MDPTGSPTTARSSANAEEALENLRATRAAVQDMSMKVLQETLNLELDNSEKCRRQLLARDAEIDSMTKLLHEREREVERLRNQVHEQTQEIMQCQELLDSTQIEHATYHRLVTQNKQLFEALRHKEAENTSLTDRVRELSVVVTEQQNHFSEKLKTTVYSESVDECRYRSTIQQLTGRVHLLEHENAQLKQGLQHCQAQLARSTNESRYAVARAVERKIGDAAATVEIQLKLERLENEAVRWKDEAEQLRQQLSRELQRNSQLAAQLQRASIGTIEPDVEVCTVQRHNKLKEQLQLAHKALFEETAGRRKLREKTGAQAEEIEQLSARIKTAMKEAKQAKDALARAEEQLRQLQQADKRSELKIQALESNRQMLREMLQIGTPRTHRPQSAYNLPKPRAKSAARARPSSERRSRSSKDAVMVPAISSSMRSSSVGQCDIRT